MPSISNMQVPPAARPVLQWLASLEAEVATEIGEALSNARTFKSARELREALSEVEQVSEEDARRLVNVLFNLISLSRSHGWPISDVVKEVVASRALDLPDDKRESLFERLRSATAAASIIGLAKAADVSTEHDHLFHTARIMTDIRPVFDDEVASGPLGAIVSHTLRLDYYERARLKTFAVTFSEEELDELSLAIARAKAKREAIHALINRTDLVEFETKSGD